MAKYYTNTEELKLIADAIREKGGTSGLLEFPDEFVEAIENITGDSGTDVSDTTATASDVLSGKEFYAADGTKTQGTILSQAAQTITPTTSDQTIASGKYLTGDQTIKGDANLIAGNIKKNVQIFGVTGTHEGGGGTAAKNDVTFYDYDGTVVAGYSASDFSQLSAMPANPSHTGLVAQGWNWSLSDAKTYVAKYGRLNIGQMYVTESGSTEIDVIMHEGRLEPILTIAVNGTITVDWGDNTTPDTVTDQFFNTRQAVPHTYANEGNYTISISATGNNKYRFYSSSAYTLLRKNTKDYENRVYANTIQNIRIGNNTEVGGGAFYGCYSLASITIPNTVTNIDNSAFYQCYSLRSVTIPDGVTSIKGYAFSGCASLANITVPNTVTSIENTTFNQCYSLTNITIPDTVTSIGSNAFYNCQSLANITILDIITSIQTYAFYGCYSLANITIPGTVTSIGNYAFYNCQSLISITIPDSVTSIGNYAFYNCCGVKEYHFLSMTVPTGGTNMFQNISSDTIIYVPASALEDYKTAENWSTYASYMQAEPQT